MNQHPSFQPNPGGSGPAANQRPANQHPSAQGQANQHPSWQPNPAAAQPAQTNQHPSFQPRPAAAPAAAPARQAPAPGGASLPQRNSESAPERPRADRPLPSFSGPTADLRPSANPAPSRRRPEWETARLSDRAVGGAGAAGRDVARRPSGETSVLPAVDGPGEELPPLLRSGNGGRHRGPRRPAVLRAAVPVVAVLAAGGGALGLVHATGTGTPESQALDATSRTADSAVTTNLANAPAGVDGGNGAGPAAGSDPASSALDGSGPGAGQHTTSGAPGLRTSAPGAPATVPGNNGSVSGSPTTSGPGTSTSSSPLANGPVQITTPTLPGTPESSAPVASPPPPTTPPSTTPGDPSATPPGTPSTPPTSSAPPTSTSPTDPPPATPTPSPTPTGPTTTPAPSPTGSSGQPPSGRVLQTGDSGPDVSNLQTELDRLGTPTWVPVTGIYDTRTADAVAYVQNKLNITDDPRGVCGPTTAAAISTLATAAH